MSDFWSGYIIVLTVINILACWWLIRWTSRKQPGEAAQGEVTGHVWDDNLEEYNNPLPRWWLWLFYITIIFAFIYLALYPGLGRFSGFLNWTQEGRYEAEVSAADAKYGPVFAQFAAQDIAALSTNPKAVAIGERLFLNYCATCHGSDARGVPGFPNLTDSDWLYGGAPEMILTSILDGRSGVMPAWSAALGPDGVAQVADYVLGLSGRKVDAERAAAGAQKFATFCASCHGENAMGNPAFGAPNLTDNIWLYGGSQGAVRHSIAEGRNGRMPPHREFLGEDKARLLAAYVFSLAQPAQP